MEIYARDTVILALGYSSTRLLIDARNEAAKTRASAIRDSIVSYSSVTRGGSKPPLDESLPISPERNFLGTRDPGDRKTYSRANRAILSLGRRREQIIGVD